MVRREERICIQKRELLHNLETIWRNLETIVDYVEPEQGFGMETGEAAVNNRNQSKKGEDQ